MRGRPPAAVACVAFVLVFIACCTAPQPSPEPSSSATRGGTLRIGVMERDGPLPDQVFVDAGRPTPGFFMRCCLARTLLTYPGETTTDGGTVLLPDIARSMPNISPDGRTWTFQLKPDIHYARPHENIQVTSTDFVTAVERSIRINAGDVFPPFRFLAGVQEFAAGTAASISGLETPDERTLVIRSAEPYGGLDFLTDPAWSPVPASVAAGHDEDFGLYWPSTGPYMYETYPADPTVSMAALVQNPSWSPETDPRRRQYVDRIEFLPVAGELSDALLKVDVSEVDFLTTRLDDEATRRYRADPGTTARVRSTPSEYLYRIPMNLAVPPFDDLAVRRAVNFAIDRVAARDAVVATPQEFNGTVHPASVLSQHMFADSITGGLLLGYDPFTLGDGRGNLSRARTEMRQSRYDTDADGLCDAAACASIAMPTFDFAPAEAIAESLQAIGLEIEPVELNEQNDMSFPSNRTAIAVLPFGWGFGLDGTELAELVRGGETLSGSDFVVNTSLVGALPEDLTRWGYEVSSVPGVDDVVDRCDREVGSRRPRCWAELDQLLAESVTPWVPLLAVESAWVSSERVEQYTLDQVIFQQFPALDKVSLVSGSE